MTSEHPRVLVGDEDCLPAAVAGILYYPGRLEESLPREVSPAVAGVPGGPPASRHESRSRDTGDRGWGRLRSSDLVFVRGPTHYLVLRQKVKISGEPTYPSHVCGDVRIHILTHSCREDRESSLLLLRCKQF